MQPNEISSAQSLIAVARLVRQFHDLSAGTTLAGDQETICRNDLSPKNTVYRDLGAGLSPVAFIDWDLAAPGKRIHDLAHVCWQRRHIRYQRALLFGAFRHRLRG